ncbi:transporter substrate-binding domain-containing protein [Leucobacter sp. L43]|uniref:transporter substrate-binding domain-containing protein n=1 Tax=Leucobacter sp. L43 TaxID=2798040 RepID=UPI00190306C8|nr:transporter substrate-binding domain-containing protein [Leucobacter sp. L43]
MRRFLSLAAVACLALLTGCSSTIPADPEGTLERATNGTLRVGVSDSPPWVETFDDASPAGTEPKLVQKFAERIDADIEWTENGEEQLFKALERGELDIVIGGLTDETPWIDFGALTVPYAEQERDGIAEKHVMAVRMGENALLVALEEFLLVEGATS